MIIILPSEFLKGSIQYQMAMKFLKISSRIHVGNEGEFFKGHGTFTTYQVQHSRLGLLCLQCLGIDYLYI